MPSGENAGFWALTEPVVACTSWAPSERKVYGAKRVSGARRVLFKGFACPAADPMNVAAHNSAMATQYRYKTAALACFRSLRIWLSQRLDTVEPGHAIRRREAPRTKTVDTETAALQK